MRIYVKKLTDVGLAQRACQYTLHSHNETKIGLRKLYGSEHSPSRTQMFWVEMDGIPSFVSTHLVRHKIGVEHYVQTNRDDRGGSDNVDRTTPVNHAMLCNGQALINMARKRFCTNSHEETRLVMMRVKLGVEECDPALAEFMVVDCVYRGQCFEPKCCGAYPSYWDYNTL